MIHLLVQSKGEPEGTFNIAPKDALSDYYKDAQEGVFEFEQKGALEVALELYLWLDLLIQSLIHKCVQNGSSNGRPYAALAKDEFCIAINDPLDSTIKGCT